MDLGLKEKVIIVTGGGKGIGDGIVKVLVAEGAIPVIVGRNEEDNLKVVAQVAAAGGRAGQVLAELTEPQECERAVRRVAEQFGSIEGLVNNAGVNDGVGLESGNYEAFAASLHSHTTGQLIHVDGGYVHLDRSIRP